MKKLRSNYTIKTFMEELEQSGRKFKRTRKGYRAQLCSCLQTAQRIIVKFSESKALNSQFVRAVREAKKKEGGKRSEQFNLSLEVVAKATAASSSAGRKLASKRAGVLDYLRERGVHVKDTASTIKKEGLEKLYSEWCKKKKGEAMATAEKSNGQPSPSVVKREANRNDREVSLPLWMKLSDRDQLLEQKLGTLLSLLVSRVSEDDGDLEVRRVVVADNLGEESDWAE